MAYRQFQLFPPRYFAAAFDGNLKIATVSPSG
jgi:hypothetical protein